MDLLTRSSEFPVAEILPLEYPVDVERRLRKTVHLQVECLAKRGDDSRVLSAISNHTRDVTRKGPRKGFILLIVESFVSAKCNRQTREGRAIL